MRLVEVDEAMRLVPPVFEGPCSARAGRGQPDARQVAAPAARRTTRGGGVSGSKFTAVLEVGGETRGYAIYRVKSEWGDRGPKNVLTVMEVTGLDPAAERALWEWLAGIDLIRTIAAWRQPVAAARCSSSSHDPRRLGLTVGDGLWVRLVDLPAALEARSYAGAGRVTLEVTDAFMPANAGAGP